MGVQVGLVRHSQRHGQREEEKRPEIQRSVSVSPRHFGLFTAVAAPANMAVSYIDTHNAIYHPYIMRRRGSKNFGGEPAATRRGRPAPRARRRGGRGRGGRGRGGGARPSPHRQWSSPQGPPAGSGAGGRRRRRGARRWRGVGCGGAVLINLGKFWHKLRVWPGCARGGAGGGPCQPRAALRAARAPPPSRPPLTSGRAFTPPPISMENTC